MKPVGFDNTFLSILLNPGAGIPIDPVTKQPVVGAKRRAEHLVETLGKNRQKVSIPTPASAELLTVLGPDAHPYFSIISRSRLFEEAAFDTRCAIELAFLNRDIFGPDDRKNRFEPYQKIKVDRQILAVFKVSGVERVYTDDGGLAGRLRLCGMTPVSTSELPLPPEDLQMQLEFKAADDIPEPEQDPPNDP